MYSITGMAHDLQIATERSEFAVAVFASAGDCFAVATLPDPKTQRRDCGKQGVRR